MTILEMASCWARLCRAFCFSSVFSVSSVFLFSFPAAAQQQRDAGERAFQKCYTCHSVDAREKGLSGPTLAGVIGRRAASQPDFAYSPAMKKAAAGGLVWSEEALDRYLADPLEMIPETTMSFPGVRDPAERLEQIGFGRR